MPVSPTVVINAAGVGSRLGMGLPKSLIALEGRPLIHWQLDLLEGVEDVLVVVGFEYQRVIDAVLDRRRDVGFVLNHRFASTGTGHSLALGAAHAAGPVVSLDGDLLVNPEDFARFLDAGGDLIGITEVCSEEPVCVLTEERGGRPHATAFTRERSRWEWTGLVKMDGPLLARGAPFVYQILEPHLPLPCLRIRTHEIDTIGDYEQASAWIRTELKGPRP